MNLKKWELTYFPDDKDNNRWQLRLKIDDSDVSSLLGHFNYKLSGLMSLKNDKDFNFLLYLYELENKDFEDLCNTLRSFCTVGQIIEVTKRPDISSKSERVNKKDEKEPANSGFSFEDLALNAAYTFEQFVIGPNNRFTAAAAQAVADNPSRIYNPFFIYGGVGLGKTHLMHAVGHHVKKKNPGARVVYATTEKFMGDVIEALKNNDLNKMREHYRKIDLLLIDDIQFIEESESTQEEFFHTFNVLHQSGKQIIISSDRPPKQLTTLEDRLRSRFEWGLIADIKSPNLETRVAILKKKGEMEHLNLDDNLLLYIASKLKSNIRELEGFLKRINAYASLTHQEVNMDLVKSLMIDLLPEEETAKLHEAALEPSKVYVIKSPPVVETSRIQPEPEAANTVVLQEAPKIPEPKISEPAPKMDLPVSTDDIVLITKSGPMPPIPLIAKPSAEEHEGGLKPIEVAFFFPEGKESELTKAKERFQDVIKKHKLKFKLAGVLESSYMFDGKVNYSFFVDLCKSKSIKITVIIGPAPEMNIDPEEFSNIIATVMDENDISLQFIPWIDLNKDYRYLNLALDITLLKHNA